MAERKTAPGAVVATRKSIDESALSRVKSFSDVAQLIQDEFGGVASGTDVLGGISVLQDKNLLVGRQLLAVQWEFRQGDHGKYVSLTVAVPTQNDGVEMWIVNDGSTGIMKQLEEITEATQRTGGVFFKGGLRRSDYTFTDDNGKEMSATTYYLSA